MEAIVDKEWVKTKKTSTRTILARYKGVEGSIYNIIRGEDDGSLFDIKKDQIEQDAEDKEVSEVKVINNTINFESKHTKENKKNKYTKNSTKGKNKVNKTSKEATVEIMDMEPDLKGWDSY
ncbi:MAG: hypothetical protein ACOYVD_11720 [Bacillota bacterium]